MIVVSIWIVSVFACKSEKDKKIHNFDVISSGAKAVTEIDKIGIYELRTYYAADGKLENLLSRFRDHTVQLFDKHGMTNVAYWTPVENNENLLVYLLGYRNRLNRDASWQAFRADPDWISAYEASRENGPLVDSAQNIFLEPTAFSPQLDMTDRSPRVFELRTYYTNLGKLDNLHARFRDHTMQLFENHGMTNIVYFNFDQDQQGAENILLYFISHTNLETTEQNWQEFMNDTEWQTAYASSIEDGRLVDSLTSVFLITTDFSPMK